MLFWCEPYLYTLSLTFHPDAVDQLVNHSVFAHIALVTQGREMLFVVEFVDLTESAWSLVPFLHRP